LHLNDQVHTGNVVQADVTSLTGRDLRRLGGITGADALIVVGGAPCQPFSKAAYWVDPGAEAAFRRARARGETVERPAPPGQARPDSRRSLVNEFWRLVYESRADGFVFENVPSILHPRNQHIIESLRHSAQQVGYQTRLLTATATDYGVAQARQRVFLLGSKRRTPDVPDPTHFQNPQDGQRAWRTAGEVLKPYAGKSWAEEAEGIEGRWAEHLRAIPPGMNYKFHTAWAGHPSPTFEAETRYWNFLLKLAPKRPSWTIPASPGPWTGPFHWSSRRLRVVELAALQGFPHGYRFSGPRREQVRQIGNAVPPPMAQQMVASVLAAIDSPVSTTR
jgi:DNA (cytosine-5)-methyltransferase 1